MHSYQHIYLSTLSVLRTSELLFLLDIVIGAPYENDNEGAIYIYNGCKTGIFQIFSQRIPGAAVFPGIKSFGAALSKSYNMNDDNVNGEYFFNLFNSKGIFNTYELDKSISKNSE